MDEFAKAGAAAQQAVKYAKDPSLQRSAQSILTFLDQRAEFERQGIQLAQAPAIATEQRVELPSLPSTTGEKTPMLPSVRGVLQEVDCRAERVRLLMQAGQRQIAFIINDPDKVIIRNAPGSTMNLTCGKQPTRTLVLIEFEEKADQTLGTLGEVRGLEFLK